MGGGGGDFRAARARMFFANISLAGVFFSMYKNFFCGLLAVHDVFFTQFFLAEVFCTSPPLPLTYLMVRP